MYGSTPPRPLVDEARFLESWGRISHLLSENPAHRELTRPMEIFVDRFCELAGSASLLTDRQSVR